MNTTFCELNQDELMDVNGGVIPAWLVIAAGVTATAAAWTAVEGASEKVGKSIYYMTH